MEVLAYQTLEDKFNIDEIEEEGPFKCTREDAWLGDGYYLWDTNMDWAIQWGINAYVKNGKEFVIGRCKVLIDERCFDLVGNMEHVSEFREIVKLILDTGYIAEESVTVPKVIEYLKKKGLFEYKVIRAADFPDHSDKVPFKFYKQNGKVIVRESMRSNPRVQICVIQKRDVLLHPFLVVYPENYLS
jgi:hypothetical protein